MESFLALFHPLVIHFPIALLLMAGVLELLRLLKSPWNLSPAIGWNLYAGTAGAFASVVTGWSRADSMGFAPELRSTLFIHRWAGVATLATALVLTFLWQASRRNPRLIPAFRITMLATVLLVGVSAHHGGLLVYGTDYYSELLGK